jgi:hypothetical protein
MGAGEQTETGEDSESSRVIVPTGRELLGVVVWLIREV